MADKSQISKPNELEKINELKAIINAILEAVTLGKLPARKEARTQRLKLGFLLREDEGLRQFKWYDSFRVRMDLNDKSFYLDDKVVHKITTPLGDILSYLHGKEMMLRALSKTIVRENTIEIKLPTNSIQDVQNYLKDYRNALEPLVLEEGIDGQLELVDCRSGSVWLEFAAYTQAAVTFIGCVVYASRYIMNKKKNVQLSKEQIKLFQINNELQQAFAESLKSELNQLADIEAQALCKKHLKKADNEKIAQVRTSIKLLSGLFEKGGQVIPGPGATQKQKDSFPDLKNLQNLVSMVKQIEGGSDTKTEE